MTLLGHVLVLGAGVHLDLNGVVKAAAVDDAARLLSGPGFVSAGGDLATHGEIDVSLLDGGSVRLVSGGLATSGRSKRRWLRGGEEQHHLIDPATAVRPRARGTRSPSAARPASLPTWPQRPPSCSGMTVPRGSTAAGFPAASSAEAASR